MGANCTCQHYIKTEIIQSFPSSEFNSNVDIRSKAKAKAVNEAHDDDNNSNDDTESLKTIHQATFCPMMTNQSTSLIPFVLNTLSLRKIKHIQSQCRLYLHHKQRNQNQLPTSFNTVHTSEISKYDHRKSFPLTTIGLIDIVNHLRDKYTVIYPSNTSKHNKQGLCHLYWNDGSSLKGIYTNNKLNGYGRIILNATRKKYLGEFINNKLNGYGVYMQSSQLSIEGQWFNGKLHGVVREEFSDGTTFEGLYEKGYRNGLGTYTFPNDSVFQGEFKGHKMNGSGILNYRNGNYYEGGFKENVFEDYGEFTWATGEKYLGFWSKGEKEGFGIYINYSDHVAYVGYWKKNKQDGLGILYNINKRKTPVFGLWRNGIKEKSYKTYASFIKEYHSKETKEKTMVKQYFYSSNDEVRFFFINLGERNYGD